MAIVTQEQVAQSATSSAKQLNSSVPLNKDRYSFRIKKATFGESKKSGNPMLTFDCEIYYPPTMVSKANGQTYEIGGTEAKTWRSFSKEALPMLLGDGVQKGFMEILGLKPEIDTENPDTQQFEGKCFSAIAGHEKRENRKELSAAEIAEGKKEGEVILNEDGSPSVSYGVKIFGDITPTKHTPPSTPY